MAPRGRALQRVSRATTTQPFEVFEVRNLAALMKLANKNKFLPWDLD
jgi:hypothetical protein